MSRLFDGVNDEVTWSEGDVVGTGAITLAVLSKLSAAGGVWSAMLNLDNGGVNQLGLTRRGTDDALMLSRDAETSSSVGPDWVAANGWSVVAVAKASGTQTPQFTVYPIGGSPTNAAGGSTLANSDANDSIVFGNMDGSDFFNGLVAAIAIFDVALSQADRESLAETLTRAHWLSLSPSFLVDELDVFQTDYAGTSTRTAIVGTADDADDPTGWGSWAAAPGDTTIVLKSQYRDYDVSYAG